MTATDYHSIRRLHVGGSRFYATRKVGNNTYSHFDPESMFGEIYIALHGHRIVCMWPNGAVAFNECGWATVTTRQRINQFLPPGYSLFQRDWTQYLSKPDGSTEEVPSHGWVLCDHHASTDQPTRESLTNLGFIREYA